MTFRRSPILSPDGGAPGCWGGYRGDAMCAACPWEWRCARYSRTVNRRFTVRQVVERFSTELEPLSGEQLTATAHRMWVGMGGERHPLWMRSAKYIEVMRGVVAACTATGADPVLYVKAQLETVGKVAVARGYRTVQPGCFRGVDADARFARWMNRINGDRGSLSRSRTEVQEIERRLTLADRFGKAYFLDGDRVAAEGSSGWAEAAGNEHERWVALAAGLDALSPGLSSTVVAPATWTMEEALQFARRVSEREAAVPSDRGDGWDDALGSLV